MIRKVVKILWIFIALISLVCVFIFFSIAKGWIGYMPPVEDLENPNYKFATEVFSEDGKVLGTYSYSKENRVFVGYNDLSPNIINALIATEDVRFAEHSGIDAYALTRAVVKRGILMQKNAAWWQYHHPAAFQTALFSQCRQCDGTSVPEAHRMGDCRKAGALLYKRGNPHHVSQQVRFPEQCGRHQDCCLYLLRLRTERFED